MITQLFEVIRSDSVMTVRCKNVFPILSVKSKIFLFLKIFRQSSRPHPPVCETMDSDPLPAVEDSAVTVTLVKLTSIASTRQPLAIWRPGDTGEAVLITVGHLQLQI